ncbi:MAG: LL-diaminopimelate aminotransferase [Chloroflexota bacterium]|nr:LL-diaminopimelate aminotransferase [Chloroflexota bacterium]MDE2883724.1 LL-diaminopimelate aminotransferase [Chloroflexota bacterium]
MQLANRLDQLPPYLFLEISRKIAEKRAQGMDVISFGIGDPDIPTPEHILTALKATSDDPPNHRYPESDGLPEMRDAIARWYTRRFDIELGDKEIVPLIGAKEGIGHMALCLIDPGDVSLVPDPAYPVYSVGTMFAGGISYKMPLLEENSFHPDLSLIPEDVARKAKVLWFNYPNNPTGALATPELFEEVVAFAKEYDVAVCHDACYSEVTFDGYVAPSFLQTPGAIDVGIEFHSLSKTYNMTGWRIGMAVGNQQLIDALIRVKSNLDSGIPQAVQYMGIEALDNTTPEWLAANNEIYRRRRDRVVDALTAIGLQVNRPKSGFYIWARCPEGWTSAQLATELLDKHAVVVTPGRGYGEAGEGYIRLSLTTPDERVDEGLKRLEGWRLPDAPAG